MSLAKIAARTGGRFSKLLEEATEAAKYGAHGAHGAVTEGGFGAPAGLYHSAVETAKDVGHSAAKFGRGMAREGQYAAGVAGRHVKDHPGAYGAAAGAAGGLAGGYGLHELLDYLDEKKGR